MAVQQVLLRDAEGLVIIGQGLFSLILKTEGRQHTGPEQEFAEERMDSEGIGPGNEVHLAVVPRKKDAQDIVEGILVVHGHQNGGPLRGNMAGIHYIAPTVKDSITGKAEIGFGKPVSQREFFHFSSLSIKTSIWLPARRCAGCCGPALPRTPAVLPIQNWFRGSGPAGLCPANIV